MPGPMRASRTDQKAENFSLTVKKMLKGFKTDTFLIIFVIFLSICSSVLTILAPLYLRNFLSDMGSLTSITPSGESVVIGIKWYEFAIQFSILASFYIVGAFLTWLAEFLTVSIANHFSYNMRKSVKEKLDRLPLSYFDRVPYGDTLSIGTNDIDNIARNMQSIIVQSFSGITLLVGSFIAMMVTKWQLGLVALGSLPFTLIIVALIAKFSQKQFIAYRKELGDLNSIVEESYAGYQIIKLFNKQEDFIEKFNTTNTKMAKADRLSQFLSGLIFPLTNFVNNLAYVGIAVVGGILKDPGTMIAFFLLLNLFTRPFQQIGQIINIIQSVVASGERIFKLLDEEEFVKDPENAINNENNIVGDFSFKNVSFAYSPDKPLIENFTLDVKAGDTVAIVGPTGAGKTTMVNLIMRFYEINGGEILLDGINTKQYMRSTLRGSIGMVLQETWLFRGTIRENLLYGNQDATEEEIKNACEEAHVSHFINTLPGGLDFILNEDGTNISQGQRQLLTIARAIISKPKIMILDEATSSVDTRTEKQIQEALDNIMKNKTSFVIAHRLSTIKNAKLIIVMKKGHIVEVGNHEELLNNKGFYYDLYNSQFNGFNPMSKQEEVLES